MSNDLSHDVLLLTASLASLQSETLIVEHFIGGINNLGLPVEAEWHDATPDHRTENCEVIEVASAGFTFGFVVLEGDCKELSQTHLAIIRNAVRIVAAVLTTRKQAKGLKVANESIQERLRETTFFNDQVLNVSPDMVYLFDMEEERCIYVSPACRTIMGMEPNEIIQMGNSLLSKLIHPDDLPRLVATQAYLITHDRMPEADLEYRIKPKHGRDWVWLSSRETVFARSENGKPRIKLGIATDITDRKNFVEQIRKSEEFLRITLRSIGDGVIVTDADGCVVNINATAEQLTGWALTEIKGQLLDNVLTLVHLETEEVLSSPAEKVMQSGQAVELSDKTVLICRTGEKYQIADTAAPIKDDQGVCYGVVVVFRDISEQSRLEEEVRQTRKMESIGKLAGGVAHDFNNVLGAILGAAQLLEKQPMNAKSKRYVGMISESAQQASELTRQLLMYSRKAPMENKPFALHEAVKGATDLLEHSLDRCISLELALEADEDLIMGDKAQLQNAFLNLGLNARDAMPEGGSIIIRTENTELSPDYCDKSAFKLNSGEYIEIQFIDSGCGMSKDVQQRVFEPFFTTKSETDGTGLGLASVYRTVVEHGGMIEIHSVLQQGTSLLLRIPLHRFPVEENEKKNEQSSTENCWKDVSVLVVDDEMMIREVVCEYFQGLCAQTYCCANGAQALHFLDHSEAGPVQLVILDMLMPKMGGAETFVKLRQRFPDLPVLLLSGYSPDDAVLRLLEYSNTAFLQKPVTFEKLIAKAEKLLSATGISTDDH